MGVALGTGVNVSVDVGVKEGSGLGVAVDVGGSVTVGVMLGSSVGVAVGGGPNGMSPDHAGPLDGPPILREPLLGPPSWPDVSKALFAGESSK